MAGNATPAATVVLVVEDEPVVRMEAVDLLAEAGFAVLEAGNAQDALAQLARRSDVGLLVTDVQMPGQPDGFGLARQVRAERPGIAIVVCSGLRSPEPGDLPAGVAFIGKPFAAHTVLRAIARAVRPHEGRNQLE